MLCVGECTSAKEFNDNEDMENDGDGINALCCQPQHACLRRYSQVIRNPEMLIEKKNLKKNSTLSNYCVGVITHVPYCLLVQLVLKESCSQTGQ